MFVIKYPVAVQIEQSETTGTYIFGAVVPDLPGCISAGNSLYELKVNTQKAIVGHIQALLDEEMYVNFPSQLEAYSQREEFKGDVWMYIEVAI